ncbi:P27 family phage terminase small subunit [Clostridium estertheticum]|uniref:P27 family phage terminase small subunit n=1 Tax=Clostridium estertheticum TaxID=238834 RepID=UPI001C6EF7F7|nr:P27 family phage terminase small subunit [Clostridium estertheticum]MBW9154296.1 P27 family phage terminase small subunit [Clostridium estertheticum]WLC86669.1 P27 family phage terminase small subunit [Clostridium estertheticum]
MKNAIEVKESLVKQLKNKKADTDYFLSLIDDYIWYFSEEQSMQEDVKKRGRSYKAKSASGFMIMKENESLKNAITFNKQKLSILKQMGLTTDNVVGDADDEM